MSVRDTYRYYLTRNGKIVYAGITEYSKTREQQHNQERRLKVKLEIVGRATTRQISRAWELEQKSNGISIGSLSSSYSSDSGIPVPSNSPVRRLNQRSRPLTVMMV